MGVGNVFPLLALLSLAAVGCSLNAGTGTTAEGIQKVWVTGSASDAEGNLPRNVKMTLTGHFSFDRPSPGTKLTGTWVCQMGIGLPRNAKLGESTITLDSSTKEGAFTLPSPATGFKHGQYEFHVSVNGVKRKTTYFKIQ